MVFILILRHIMINVLLCFTGVSRSISNAVWDRCVYIFYMLHIKRLNEYVIYLFLLSITLHEDSNSSTEMAKKCLYNSLLVNKTNITICHFSLHLAMLRNARKLLREVYLIHWLNCPISSKLLH